MRSFAKDRDGSGCVYAIQARVCVVGIGTGVLVQAWVYVIERECVCEPSLPKFLSCTTRSVFQEVHATCTDVPNGDIKKKKYALQIF